MACPKCVNQENITSNDKGSSSSKVSKILFYVIHAVILCFIIWELTLFANLSEVNFLLTITLILAFVYARLTSLFVLFFYFICFEKILEKAGKHWWQMFIPIYNIYLICKVSTGNSKLFWPIIIWAIIAMRFIFSSVGGILPGIGIVPAVILVLVSLAIWIFLAVGLADRFNVNRVLMVLLGFIMLPVIAFSKSYTYDLNISKKV